MDEELNENQVFLKSRLNKEVKEKVEGKVAKEQIGEQKKRKSQLNEEVIKALGHNFQK